MGNKMMKKSMNQSLYPSLFQLGRFLSHKVWMGCLMAAMWCFMSLPLQAMSDINLQKGTVAFSEVDLKIPGKAGLDFVLSRQYDSQKYLSQAAPEDQLLRYYWDAHMGAGWSSSLANRLMVGIPYNDVGTNTGNVVVETGTQLAEYEWDDDEQAYMSKIPNNYSKVVKQDDTYTLITENGLRYEYARKFYDERNLRFHYETGDWWWKQILEHRDFFDVHGYYLTKVYDLHGNAITYSYETYKDEMTYYGEAHGMWSIDFPHGRNQLQDRVNEAHPIRKYVDGLVQNLVEFSSSQATNKRVFNREVEHEYLRVSSVTDTFGRTFTFTYDTFEKEFEDELVYNIYTGDVTNSDIRTVSVLKEISYLGTYGNTRTISYVYDDDGLLSYVDKGDGPNTTYTYTDYEPEFKNYRRTEYHMGIGTSFESCEFPHDDFVQLGDGVEVKIVDEMGRFEGHLLASVTNPLGGITSYEYRDNVFRYLKSIDQTVMTQKSVIDAYTYPVITTKTIQSSASSPGHSYDFEYPEDDDHKPLQHVFGYSDTYSEETIIEDVLNSFLVGRSAMFVWGQTSAYFKTITITPSGNENPRHYEWSKGLATLEDNGTRKITRSYRDDYLPEKMTETNGGQITIVDYLDYDDYGNLTQSTRRNQDSSLSVTKTMTYETDADVMANGLYRLLKTSVTVDDGTEDTSPTHITSYSDTGRVLEKSESYNGETKVKETYTYNADGRVHTKTIPGQNPLTYTYDDAYTHNGSPAIKVEQTIQVGAKTFTRTSIMDLSTSAPLSDTDANGATTLYDYDGYDRLVKTTLPDGTEKLVSYSDDLTEETHTVAGVSVTTKKDGLGRTVWVDNADGVEDTMHIYDSELDRVSSIQKGTLSGGVLLNARPIKSYEYDTYGRKVSTVDPNWGTSTVIYDDDALTITSTDFAGRSVEKIYNDFNQVTLEKVHADTQDPILKTAYTSLIGDEGYVTDGRGLYHKTAGIAGWFHTRYHPGSSLAGLQVSEEKTFRDDGQVATHEILGKNGDTRTYAYSYDELGRVTDVAVNDNGGGASTKATYTYDEENHGYSKGKLTTSENDDVSQTFTYDIMGNVIDETTTIKDGNVAIQLQRSFNDQGFLDTTTYGDGTALTYTYDDLNRLKTVSYQGDMIVTYYYTLKGTIDYIEYGNSMEQQYDYEKDVLVTAINTKHPTKGKYLNERYSYDDRGRMVTNRIPAIVTGTAVTRNFTYTDRDELESVTETVVDSSNNDDTSENGTSDETSQENETTTHLYSYAYDNNGNMLSFDQPNNHSVISLSLTPDASSDELVSVVKGYADGDETISYTYDLAGNMTKKETSDQVLNLMYNWQNQLVGYEDVSDETYRATYAYNNARERVYSQVQIPGRGGTETKETYYIWDAGQIIGEQTADGDIYVKYIYSGNQKIAMIRPSSAGNDRIYYFINNIQGTPRLIVDQNATVYQRQDMDPWGNLEDGVSQKNEVNFTGKKKDRLSGLFYFNQRYYDAETGRFIQKDPAEQFLNPYVYGANNPLSYVDPDGQFAFTTMFLMMTAYALDGAVKGYLMSGLQQFNTSWGKTVDGRLMMDAAFQGAKMGAITAGIRYLGENFNNLISGNGFVDNAEAAAINTNSPYGYGSAKYSDYEDPGKHLPGSGPGKGTRPASGQVTSEFKMERTLKGKETRPHLGTDFAEGNSNAYSRFDGTVSNVYKSKSFGNVVEVEWKDHPGQYSLYAHLKNPEVYMWQEISAGEVIGIIGDTGDASEGIHLHYAEYIMQNTGRKLYFDPGYYE